VKSKLLMRYDTANGGVTDSDSDVVVENLVSENGNEKFGFKRGLLNFGVVDFVVMMAKATFWERNHFFNMVWKI
jgi:hypothetical protein